MEPKFEILLHAILIELQTMNDIELSLRESILDDFESVGITPADRRELDALEKIIASRDAKYNNMQAGSLLKLKG